MLNQLPALYCLKGSSYIPFLDLWTSCNSYFIVNRYHTNNSLCKAATIKHYSCLPTHLPRVSNNLYEKLCISGTKRFFFHSPTYWSMSETLSGTTDRYNGIWVDLTQTSICEIKMSETLQASLESWKSKEIKAVWLKVLLSQGNIFQVASQFGFKFHHAEGNEALLYLWMNPQRKSKLPSFATHQVGVSGMVIREDTNEVLVVKDKNRQFQLWKFPGGLSDLGEDIAYTAEREVLEETGVITEYQSVLAFRQQHDPPGAFGRSDLYVICRLKPRTYELSPCEDEIESCRWMPLDELKAEVKATSLTHKMADLALYGLKHGFYHVDISSYQMASVYKGLKFHIFHRPFVAS